MTVKLLKKNNKEPSERLEKLNNLCSQLLIQLRTLTCSATLPIHDDSSLASLILKPRPGKSK